MHFTSADSSAAPLWDLARGETIEIVGQAADEGLLDILLAVPPCSTWSRARWNHSTGGAPPVRGRFWSEWGYLWLRGNDRRQVQDANACLTGTLSAQDTVTGYGGGSLLEHPEDAGCEPYASI